MNSRPAIKTTPSRTTAVRNAEVRALTLVELLVVIAIIAILAVVLFPAIGRMTTVANQTKCASNLRQVFVAEMAYAADNNNRIRSASQAVAVNTVIVWSQWLTGVNAPGGKAYVKDYGIFICPSQDPKGYDPKTGSIFRTYGMLHPRSSLAFIQIDGANVSTDTWMRDFGDSTKSLSDEYHVLVMVPKPSAVPLLADTAAYQGAATKLQLYYFYPNKFVENAGIHLRHNGRANILFYDGHVAALDRNELAALGIKVAVSADYQPLALP